jgi:hypothetical protein
LFFLSSRKKAQPSDQAASLIVVHFQETECWKASCSLCSSDLWIFLVEIFRVLGQVQWWRRILSCTVFWGQFFWWKKCMLKDSLHSTSILGKSIS